MGLAEWEFVGGEVSVFLVGSRLDLSKLNVDMAKLFMVWLEKYRDTFKSLMNADFLCEKILTSNEHVWTRVEKAGKDKNIFDADFEEIKNTNGRGEMDNKSSMGNELPILHTAWGKKFVM